MVANQRWLILGFNIREIQDEVEKYRSCLRGEEMTIVSQRRKSFLGPFLFFFFPRQTKFH